MKQYQTKDIRNIAIVGHNTVGKTTLTDSIAFYLKATTRMGDVNSGSTISDYSDAEIEKKYSIRSTLLSLENNKTKLNLIDCPGYMDFIGESYAAIRIADTALITVEATSREVEVGTEKGFEIAEDSQTSRAFFINKCDAQDANYEKAVMALKNLSPAVTRLQFPAGEGNNFKGIIDIFSEKMFSFKDGKIIESEIPAEYQEKVEELKENLVETVASSDEVLMDKYFENGELSSEEFYAGLKKAFCNKDIFPVFCGSATTQQGIPQLLENIEKIFPAPCNIQETIIENDEEKQIDVNSEGKNLAYIFKDVSEGHVGDMFIFKVISGKITSGTSIYNSGTSEKIGQVYFMVGKKRIDAEEVIAGDIGTVVKLKHSHTDDTLNEKGEIVKVKPTTYPSALMWEALETKDRKDETKIGTALSHLSDEDPTFGYEIEPELHQTIIHGQGDKHIETVMAKLHKRYGIDVILGQPKIPYRETITKSTEGFYRHKKQTGGKGQFAEVHMKLRPKERGEGFNFVNAIVGGAIPSRYIPAVEKGIQETMVSGIISGSKVIDIEVELYDGKFHDVDSSEMAFKIAASQCLKKLFKDANPILLEPINDIKIICPEEFTGDIMGDISAKRGRPEGITSVRGKQQIKAKVPKSELFRYATTLRTMTQGRGIFETSLSGYELVPREVQQQIVENYEKEQSEDHS